MRATCGRRRLMQARHRLSQSPPGPAPATTHRRRGSVLLAPLRSRSAPLRSPRDCPRCRCRRGAEGLRAGPRPEAGTGTPRKTRPPPRGKRWWACPAQPLPCPVTRAPPPSRRPGCRFLKKYINSTHKRHRGGDQARLGPRERDCCGQQRRAQGKGPRGIGRAPPGEAAGGG